MNSTRILKTRKTLYPDIKDTPQEKNQSSIKSYPNLGFEENDNLLSINYEKAFIGALDSPYNGFYKNAASYEKEPEIVQLVSDRRGQSKSSSIGQYIEQEPYSVEPQVKQEERNYQEQNLKNSQIKQNAKLKMEMFSASESQSSNQKSLQQQYVPQSSNAKQAKARKACETKNITKNFGKAIITFILKNRPFTKKFCKQFSLDQKAFLRKVKSFQSKVATIKGLRQFWLQGNNTYAKYVRMLSMLYLRKHSLEHIFNSRIQNYSINIKYRIKMMQSISNPEQFTYIKEN